MGRVLSTPKFVFIASLTNGLSLRQQSFPGFVFGGTGVGHTVRRPGIMHPSVLVVLVIPPEPTWISIDDLGVVPVSLIVHPRLGLT